MGVIFKHSSVGKAAVEEWRATDVCCLGQADAPLFKSQFSFLEHTLLKDINGMWPERLSMLFALILKSCAISAVHINGYWKNDDIWPGQRRATHNHCWSAVKMKGRSVSK